MCPGTIIIHTSAKEVVFTGVGLFVSLLTTLLKKLLMDFD